MGRMYFRFRRALHAWTRYIPALLVLAAILSWTRCAPRDGPCRGDTSDDEDARCNHVMLFLDLQPDQDRLEPDAYEPNDSAAQAYCVVGQPPGTLNPLSYRLKFTGPDDRDFFRVQVPSAGTTFTVSFPFSTNLDGSVASFHGPFRVRFFAADGSTVLRDVPVPSAETPIVESQISSFHDKIYPLDHAFTAAGTHYLEFTTIASDFRRVIVEFYGTTDSCP